MPNFLEINAWKLHRYQKQKRGFELVIAHIWSTSQDTTKQNCQSLKTLKLANKTQSSVCLLPSNMMDTTSKLSLKQGIRPHFSYYGLV